MKKTILTILCVSLILTVLAGCNTSSTDFGDIDFLAIQRLYAEGNYASPSAFGAHNSFESEVINNPNGFVIKVYVTEEFENVINHTTVADFWNEASLAYEHGFISYEEYSSFERDEFDRILLPVICRWASHIRTNVVIQEIYHAGENIDFNVDDILSLRESVFLAPEQLILPFQIGENEYSLHLALSGVVKLIPGREYIIWGRRNTDNDYASISLKTGIHEVRIDDNRDMANGGVDRNDNGSVLPERGFEPLIGEYIVAPSDYWCSSNAEQVIADFLEEHYRRVGR